MPSIEELVAGVKAHANAHYEQDGWDIVVEAYTDAEIADVVKKCRTVRGAIRKMGACCGIQNDYREDIQATAW